MTNQVPSSLLLISIRSVIVLLFTTNTNVVMAYNINQGQISSKHIGVDQHHPTSNNVGPTSITKTTIDLNDDHHMISIPNKHQSKSSNQRRNFLQSLITSSFILSSTTMGCCMTNSHPSYAIDDDNIVIDNTNDNNNVMESIYFGVGCFWHIQHEMIEAERNILHRTNNHELTSITGYAGGTKTDTTNNNRVCYHNFQNIADYGQYGHGEVVNLIIPYHSILNFTSVYFDLYNPKTHDRVDPQDRGSEYRSMIGLPNGIQHPLYNSIEQIAMEYGYQLQQGNGNDPDTLGKQIVYVYDTKVFPFYQAEIYHQYHNDFQSKPYGKEYNSLAEQAFEDGRLKITGCPDKV